MVLGYRVLNNKERGKLGERIDWNMDKVFGQQEQMETPTVITLLTGLQETGIKTVR